MGSRNILSPVCCAAEVRKDPPDVSGCRWWRWRWFSSRRVMIVLVEQVAGWRDCSAQTLRFRLPGLVRGPARRPSESARHLSPSLLLLAVYGRDRTDVFVRLAAPVTRLLRPWWEGALRRSRAHGPVEPLGGQNVVSSTELFVVSARFLPDSYPRLQRPIERRTRTSVEQENVNAEWKESRS